jgi:phosphate transport system permease protein
MQKNQVEAQASLRSLWFSRFAIEASSVALFRLCAIAAGLISVLILAFLLRESLGLLSQVNLARFWSDRRWNPTSGEYNLLPMLAGSLLVTGGAVLLAVPLGLLSALFCQYYAPPVLASAYRRLVELLAGIPSVVYGLWGLGVLVPLVNRWQPPGSSLLTGVLVLALMILPTFTLVAEASLAQVPGAYLRGGAALGLNQWAIARSIAIPAARAGLATAAVLATGRAIGETMAVLMVCGNVVQMPNSLFAPVRTLTANIALEMAYATGNHRSALFVSGVMLLALVSALVLLAEVLNSPDTPL